LQKQKRSFVVRLRLVEAAARHRGHADILHQVSRELDIVGESEA